MRIIVDAMGGDNAPQAIVKGSVMARDEYNVNIVLSGKEALIKKCLEQETSNHSNIEILNAEDVITNEDKPVVAIRSKKDSSMVKGLYAVKNKEADAIVSAGSTGALLTGGTLIVGRIGKLERPCLAPFIPRNNGFTLLVDAGANMDCKPEYLYDFAVMGNIYFKCVFKVDKPRVGLLNVGAEEGKGNKLALETYELLKKSDLNFIGNVEARDVLTGCVDVLVADGFEGNILLKAIEGTAQYINSSLKEDLMTSTRTKIGALLAKPAFKKLKQRMDYDEVGGAILLGANSPVIKAHGSSDHVAFKNAIKQAKNILDSSAIELIRQSLIK